MSRTGIIAVLAALVVGFGAGALSPIGDRDVAQAPPADEPAPPAVTPTPAATPPPAGPSLPEPCRAALATADEATRFTPEALARLRAAHDQAEGAGETAPPPDAVFAQLQSQAQSYTARFSTSRQACESATP